jgi:hypothetical protein
MLSEILVGEVCEVPTSEIHLDPARLQWRSGISDAGTCGRLSGIKVFSPLLCGILTCWQSDGRLWCLDGHHRASCARRLGVPSLLVRVITCPTAEEARLVGALLNISQQAGTALDAAAVFRSGCSIEEAAELGVSFAGKLAKEARLLAQLSPLVWDAVTLQRISVEVAVAIGAASAEHAHQDALHALAVARGLDADQLAECGRMAESARIRKAAESAQLSLLPPPVEESDLAERIEVRLAIRSRLDSERRALGCVRGTYGSYLAQAGCQLDYDGAASAKARVKALLASFDRLASQPSPVSDLIDVLCVEVAAGGNARKLVDQHFGMVIDALGV